MYLSEILLLFVLGLRHGLDPDHIAVIDNLTLRFLEHRPRLAGWVGTLFALGHGLVVTVLAVLVSWLAPTTALPAWLLACMEWVPTVLLVVIGFLNLAALHRPAAPYRPVGWRHHLLPARWQRSLHPAGVVLTGVLFATVFDTATQAAAWGYVATGRGGWPAALLLGVVFTLGMVLTDTLDCRLVCRLLGQPTGTNQHRRGLGWSLVVVSFGVAAYQVLTYLLPALILSELHTTLLGAGLVGAGLAAYAWLRWRPATA